MDQYERSKPLKTLEYRIAARQIEFALEARKRLPREEQELLLREVAERILQQLKEKPNAGSVGQLPVAVPEEKASTVKVLGVEVKLS